MLWIIAYIIVGIISATVAVYEYETTDPDQDPGELVVPVFLCLAFWPALLVVWMPISIGKAIARMKEREPRR